MFSLAFLTSDEQVPLAGNEVKSENGHGGNRPILPLRFSEGIDGASDSNMRCQLRLEQAGWVNRTRAVLLASEPRKECSRRRHNL